MEILHFGLAFCGVLLALISSLTSTDASLYSFMMFAALVVSSPPELYFVSLTERELRRMLRWWDVWRMQWF